MYGAILLLQIAKDKNHYDYWDCNVLGYAALSYFCGLPKIKIIVIIGTVMYWVMQRHLTCTDCER
jgi:hypothetical protein